MRSPWNAGHASPISQVKANGENPCSQVYRTDREWKLPLFAVQQHVRQIVQRRGLPAGKVVKMSRKMDRQRRSVMDPEAWGDSTLSQRFGADSQDFSLSLSQSRVEVMSRGKL
jgi:hypothetical protein